MASESNNKGFVLLMVLVLLAVAGVVLASLARQSCELASQASAARRDLQIQWGSLSSRELVLPSAAEILDQPENDGDKPPCTIRKSLTLGTIKFDLLLCDEQAKANVNLLAKRREGQGVDGVVQSLQSSARNNLRVQLRPAKPQNDLSFVGIPPLYAFYDQIFEYKHPSELADPAATEDTPVSRLTCWGNGQVNFRKASRDVLRAVTEGVLDETQLDALVKLAQNNPYATIQDAMKVLKLPAEKTPLAGELLTDQSGCFSLWIVADDSTRKYYRLYVAQGANALNDRQSVTFGW